MKKVKSYLDIKADRIYQEELKNSKNYKKPKIKKKKNKKRRLIKTNSKASGVYFKFAKNINPSFAEIRIAKILNGLEVDFYQEVMFNDFISPKGGVYRFDFYLPKYSLIIEYDGITHESSDVKRRDEEKNKFCEEKELTLLRFNRTNWKDLENAVIISVNKVIEDYNSSLI